MSKNGFSLLFLFYWQTFCNCLLENSSKTCMPFHTFFSFFCQMLSYQKHSVCSKKGETFLLFFCNCWTFFCNFLYNNMSDGLNALHCGYITTANPQPHFKSLECRWKEAGSQVFLELESDVSNYCLHKE